MERGDRSRSRGPLTQLLPDRLEGLDVLFVLALVLDLFPDALKDADGRRVVVDPAAGPEGRLDDRGAGDEVVGEAVVEAALQLKQVLDAVKEGDVALVEGVKGLLGLVRRVAPGSGYGERMGRDI